jgi:hypothetical protein
MSTNPDLKNDYMPDLLPFDKKTPTINSIDDLNK